MGRDEAIMRLRTRQEEFTGLGVRHLFLFGSTARDEAGAQSDLDLFFEHERGAIGLFRLMEIAEQASTILGRRADVATRASLHPTLRARIEADAVRVC